MTSFREQIMSAGGGTWSIPLATHLGTTIINETTTRGTTPSAPLARREAQFARNFHQRLPPLSGYNCFGCVFAGRRTGIYPSDDELITPIIKRILQEDGYGKIPESDARIGDIVIYFDGDEAFHAAMVVGLPQHRQVTVIRALSKFDLHSGEYEHDAYDRSWWQASPLRLEFYRPRVVDPAPSTGWRELIMRL